MQNLQSEIRNMLEGLLLKPVKSIVETKTLEDYKVSTGVIAEEILEELNISSSKDIALEIITEMLDAHKSLLENTVTIEDLNEEQLRLYLVGYSNYVTICLEVGEEPKDIYHFIEKTYNKFIIKPIIAVQPVAYAQEELPATREDAQAIGEEVRESKNRTAKEDKAITDIMLNPSLVPVETSVFDENEEDLEDSFDLLADDDEDLDPEYSEEESAVISKGLSDEEDDDDGVEITITPDSDDLEFDDSWVDEDDDLDFLKED